MNCMGTTQGLIYVCVHIQMNSVGTVTLRWLKMEGICIKTLQFLKPFNLKVGSLTSAVV